MDLEQGTPVTRPPAELCDPLDCTLPFQDPPSILGAQSLREKNKDTFPPQFCPESTPSHPAFVLPYTMGLFDKLQSSASGPPSPPSFSLSAHTLLSQQLTRPLQDLNSTVSSKSTPAERIAQHSTQAPNTSTANTSTQVQTRPQHRLRALRPRTPTEHGRRRGEAGDEKECSHLRCTALGRRYVHTLLVTILCFFGYITCIAFFWTNSALDAFWFTSSSHEI